MVLKAMLASMGMRHPERGDRDPDEHGDRGPGAVGLVVTLVSATLPARRASKVAPIAALRDVALDRSAASKRRTVTGVLLLGLGVVALLAGLSGSGPALVGLGAVVVFVGVSVLGPVLARPVAFVLGAPMAKLRGMAGRSPGRTRCATRSRTARTAASLMIGVGLVAFIIDLRRFGEDVDGRLAREDYHGTHIVDSGAFDGTTGISPELADDPPHDARVQTVAEQRVTQAEVDGTMTDAFSAFDGSTIDSCSTSGRSRVTSTRSAPTASPSRPASGRKLGDTVKVAFPSGARDVRGARRVPRRHRVGRLRVRRARRVRAERAARSSTPGSTWRGRREGARPGCRLRTSRPKCSTSRRSSTARTPTSTPS